MRICFKLTQGAGCFNGFLASMLMAYLLTTHRISNTMTAYQLLRNSLNFLGKMRNPFTMLCVLWLQSEIFIFGLVFKSILPPILSRSIYWPHSKWNQPSQRSWFYRCECWNIETSWRLYSFMSLMDKSSNYCVFFLFAHGAAIPARVPWCFPGRVCGPIWAPQHVCRHDGLHIQTGKSYKYLNIFLFLRFFQTSLIFSFNLSSASARGVCVNAVLGQSYRRWVPQPPHDP